MTKTTHVAKYLIGLSSQRIRAKAWRQNEGMAAGRAENTSWMKSRRQKHDENGIILFC